MESSSVVIIGAGPAGRGAASIDASARMLSRPEMTVWHAEPGLVWTESADGVGSVRFDILLLCADEPLLLMALGCAFRGDRVVVDAHGATSVPGVFAAGRVLGAATAEEAARQGRIAARAALGAASGAKPEGTIKVTSDGDETAPERLDPLALTALLEQPPSAARNATALAQARARGPGVSGLVAPVRPVGFAALAAIAPAILPERGIQPDDTALKGALA